MTDITRDIRYIGVDDHKIDLFESQYAVPEGMTYNSYVILDEKIAVTDTVDAKFTDEWLGKLADVLDGRKPDYLIIHHMEPDHSSSLAAFMKAYPGTAVVANARAMTMIDNFYGKELCPDRMTVDLGDTLPLGAHTLSFIPAPMVHWPEVTVSYDMKDKVLFSADAFGRFGASDAVSDWDTEARRYYIGIVGKYGAQVQALLKAAGALDISAICPLHGPVLSGDVARYIKKYDLWSSYSAESQGVAIAYTSVYGHTREAVELLAKRLRDKGCPEVAVYDLARDDASATLADAFRYDKLVLATTTYNSTIFPFMKHFIDHLTERNFQRRTVGFIENGSWAPLAARTMKCMLEKSKDIAYLDTTVTIKSALTDESKSAIEKMADELCAGC